MAGNVIEFELSEPMNLFVEIEGEEKHPLFIFVSPLEVDVPDAQDSNVIYFGPGVHDVGRMHTDLPSGTTVYVAGGAYVKGLFGTQINADPVHFRGRGIISGIEYEHNPSVWENHMLYIPGSANQKDVYIEGLTFTDGPKTCINTRSGAVIDNVKCFGWKANTDGTNTGADIDLEQWR